MNTNYQDWTPVVLKKTPPKTTTKQPAPPHLRQENKQSLTSINTKRLAEDEDYRPPTLTRELGQQIQNARSEKKWTQDQLAQKCNIPSSIIKTYEKGSGLYDRKYLDPICKTLGIKLSKPKTKPIVVDE